MHAPEPEFSRILSVGRIPPKGIEEHLEASPAERKALAKRFNLSDLPMLKARLTLTPGQKDEFIAAGTIDAEVVQTCVATLEPLARHLELAVNVVFMPEASRRDPAAPSFDELEDEYEYYKGGKIDLGEMVAQQMGVNIDPYPRQPQAPLVRAVFGEKSAPGGPLAALADVVRMNKKAKENKGKKTR